MNEFELIAKIIPRLPVNQELVLGPGHDCALLDVGLKDDLLLFKTDAVVEGIHFTSETPPQKIGRKALARCLSDAAAMGGLPTACLVTIGLPRSFDPDYVLAIFDGLGALAREHGVAVAGGETTTSPERIFLSVALLGKVSRAHQVTRGGAKPGHGIFVTGELGGSLAAKHLDFDPRLKEGRWLVTHFPVSAMIDLSDGLAGDLRHIMEASHVGADLLSNAIPISGAAKVKSGPESSAKPRLLAALTDGEDFELLFTLPPGNSVRLVDAWKREFPETKLSCIGKITAEPGLRLRDKDGTRLLGLHGYTHFQKS